MVPGQLENDQAGSDRDTAWYESKMLQRQKCFKDTFLILFALQYARQRLHGQRGICTVVGRILGPSPTTIGFMLLGIYEEQMGAASCGQQVNLWQARKTKHDKPPTSSNSNIYNSSHRTSKIFHALSTSRGTLVPLA